MPFLLSFMVHFIMSLGSLYDQFCHPDPYFCILWRYVCGVDTKMDHQMTCPSILVLRLDRDLVSRVQVPDDVQEDEPEETWLGWQDDVLDDEQKLLNDGELRLAEGWTREYWRRCPPANKCVLVIFHHLTILKYTDIKFKFWSPKDYDKNCIEF